MLVCCIRCAIGTIAEVTIPFTIGVLAATVLAFLSAPMSAHAQTQRSDTIVRTAAATPRYPGLSRLAPELTIGVATGSPEYMFGGIREFLINKDGSVWILDGTAGPGGATGLSIFTAQGRFVRRVGRLGDGPGEFRTPAGIAQLPDGRVLLRETRANHITVFKANGDYDATWKFPASYHWHTGGNDGVFADTAGIVYVPFGIGARAEGEIDRLAFARLRSNGTVIDTVPWPDLPPFSGTYISITVQSATGSINSQVYSSEGWAAWSPFGYMVTFGPGGNSFEMRMPTRRALYSGATSATAPPTWLPGDPVVSVKLGIPPVELSAMEQRDLTSFLRATAGDRPPVSPGDPPPTAPRTKPPYRYPRVRDDGRIWLMAPMPSERYQPEAIVRRDGSRTTPFNWREQRAYDVYEPDGTYIMRVLMPDDVHPHAARGDVLWSTVIDADGVSVLRKFRIVHN